MANSDIESRLNRLESLFVTAGDMMLQTSELSRRNTQQIERNTQQIERNAQQLIQLEQIMAQLALQATSDRVAFEEFRRTTQAALEKIDRVLDYLIQRDDRQAE
jgi:hypothetical protein